LDKSLSTEVWKKHRRKIDMQSLTGKPELMKKMNITLIYRALIELRSATRAEISDKTKISTTTVRTLLEELLQQGEISELNLDESSGGRRAQRYTLNLERNLILSFYLEENILIYQICDLIGNIVKTDSEVAEGKDLPFSVIQFVAKCLKKWNICAIGLGVPGIVENERYYISNGFNLWCSNNLGEQIQNTYHVPVILENDLNAIALGFAIHYAEKNKSCDLDQINMTYINFNKDCTGAGIIADGKIVHGAKQFAGELGFLPMLPNKNLDAMLQEASNSQEYADTVARLISIVNCITNPSLVVIGGIRFQTDWIHLDSVKSSVQSYISNLMLPEIIFSKTSQDDYLAGLTHLTRQSVIFELPFSCQD
jgi:predicted NBD/HSP70 family sugar kinase